MKYANQIQFSPNSKFLAVKSATPKIAVYDLDSMTLVHIFKIKSSQPQDGGFIFSLDSQYIFNLVYTDDLYGYVERLNIKDKTQSIIFEPEKCSLSKIVFAEDKYLIYGFEKPKPGYSKYNIHLLFEFDDVSLSFIRHDIDMDVWDLAFNTKQQKYIIRHRDGKVSVLNKRYKAIGMIPPRNIIGSLLYHISFSNTGKYIALAWNNQIQFYLTKNLKLIGHKEVEYGCFVGFNIDDTQIFVGTWNNGFIYKIEELLNV